MRNIISVDFSNKEARKSVVENINNNPDTEVALALGGIVDGTSAKIMEVLEYEGAKKSEGHVSFTSDSIEKADQDFAERGLQTVGQSHDHLEEKGHPDNWSEQDEETIKSFKQDTRMHTHVLLYKKEDGSVEGKAVDRNLKTVPFVVNGTKGNIVRLFEDGEYELEKAA